MRRVGKGFSGRETPLFPTMMVQAQEEMGEGSANPTDPYHTPTIIQPSTSQPQKKQRSRRPKRKDTKVPQPSGPTDNVADEAVYEEMDDSLEKVATTTTRLDVEQYRDSGPRRQETMGDTIAQTGFENVFKLFNNSLLARDTRRVESFDEEGLGEEDASNREDRGGVSFKSAKPKADKDSYKTRHGTITTTTVAKTVTATSIRPKAKGLVIHEDEQATTPTVSSQQPSQVKAQDKGKGIMVEEPVKMKKKDQISLDEELAFKLQAEEEEERLAREKAQREEEANIVAWDNVQAMIDVDYQMAQQIQAEEQEKLSIEKKSKFFVQLLEARKKHFAAMRAQEKRNKPPTKSQKRNTMSTYLKNMAGYKHNQLKNNFFVTVVAAASKSPEKLLLPSVGCRKVVATTSGSPEKQLLPLIFI
ncbi:hypothetical protein Tco_0194987 [Tanacetum coccineum]